MDFLRGRSIQEVMRNRDLHHMVRETLSEGTSTEGDITLYQYGEQILSTRCTSLRDPGGDPLGVLLVINDVTQLRRLENMRSDFAANVSHEIKTPLTAIQGFVETLLHGSVDDPAQVHRFLGIIEKHVRRLSVIIDDLMHLSRLEQDQDARRLTMEKGPVTDVIHTAVGLCRSKADENWNLCLRLQADLDNLHKRSERDLANAHKFALERFAQELLPVRDSLEMGLATSAVGQVDPDRLQEGVELTLQMLTTALGKFGITEINPQLERFNPDFHQAMSMQERADVEPNTVVTVVQKGYLLNDRLLRPAMVIVSHAPRDTGGARDSGSPGEES